MWRQFGLKIRESGMPILSGTEFSSLFNAEGITAATHVDFICTDLLVAHLQSVLAFGDWSRDTADYRRRCRVFVSK